MQQMYFFQEESSNFPYTEQTVIGVVDKGIC